jgi:hypothetical protein
MKREKEKKRRRKWLGGARERRRSSGSAILFSLCTLKSYHTLRKTFFNFNWNCGVSEDGRGDVLARHLGQLGSELSLLKGKDERLCIQQCSQSWHFSIASFAIIFLPI